ncbi:MAG TPA: O-methyltransferase [Solirubrobacteraceae bacterium]|jgi:predicted O-methyltransferase YrrM
MSEWQWSAVDRYVSDLLVEPDPALDEALRCSESAGLPRIAVSPPQGKMLHLLARIHGARRILEVGTLGGYSTIWLARALPAGGHLVTLELDPGYAAVARENIARAGLEELIDLRVAPALDSLAALAGEGGEPFDLTFIDADKKTTPEYFEAAIGLSRPGAVIVVDNVVRGGALIDPASEDQGAQGMRRFHAQLAARGGLTATTIQTVGAKGYDGFTLVLLDGGSPPASG